MIRRNGDLLLEDDATRVARTRRASLYRAAAALALMSALLAWLMLDEDDAAPAGEVAALAPSLAVPTLPATPVTPLVLPESDGQGQAGRAESAVTEQGYPSLASTPESAPDAVAVSTPITAAEPTHVADAPVAPMIASTASVKDKAPEKVAPAPAVSVPEPAAGAADGFRIQLGQFVDMRPATTLRDTLLRQGYAVRLQVRVGAGPYAQRKAAESALAKMRGERGLGGLIVAPPSGKGFIVQLGVFAESGNADELAARVKAWGYTTQLHARVVVGPYPDQQSAQAALQKLQRERSMEGVVIMPST